MARLFITPKEQYFIADVTKELIKDVIGLKIYLYPVSEFRTLAHEVYREAMQKVFDHPIEIDAIIGDIQTSTIINSFSVENQYKIDVFVAWKDMVDRGIQLSIGDYFSHGDTFYEITELVYTRHIYGQPEWKDGLKLTGIKVRESQFKAVVIGPTDISHTDEDAVQTTYVQQRGREENMLGETGDKRDLVDQGILEPSITGPKKVIPEAGGGFYDED